MPRKLFSLYRPVCKPRGIHFGKLDQWKMLHSIILKQVDADQLVFYSSVAQWS